MDSEKLVLLREQIFQDIEPLLVESTQNGIEKFELIMRIIKVGSASNELYLKAYECAKTIEDPSDKLDALLSIIDEIDIDINQPENIKPVQIEEHRDDAGQNDNQGL